MSTREIAVVDSVDVVVMEGTTAGCALAYYLAKRGLTVALVCSGTSPGYEVAACLRPFGHGDEIDAMPSPFAAIFEKALMRESFETVFFSVAPVAEGLEDLLLDARVHLSYTATPGGALFDRGRLAGVLVGGKFGLQAILAPTVVDCSPWASTARMAGATLEKRSEDKRLALTYTVLCKQDLPALETYPIPPEVVASTSVLTRGYFADLCQTVDFDVADPLFHARMSSGIRRDLLEVCRWIAGQESVPRLEIVRGAESCLPAPMWRLCSPVREVVKSGTRTAAACTSHVPNLFVLSQCSDQDAKEAALIHRSFHHAIYRAAQLAAVLPAATQDPSALSSLEARTGLDGTAGGLAEAVVSVADPAFAEPGMRSVSVALPDFPVAAETEVLVVGAGTSGAPAAVLAAEQGASVLCIEGHGDVGGTCTIGGVVTPWFGYRPPWFEGLQSRLRATRRAAYVPQAIALAELMRGQGVDLLSSLPVAGVLLRGRKIEAVIALGTYGPVAIRCSQLIDATGDGDVVAWAGAASTYGTERDDATLWCSFGLFSDKRPAVSRKYRTIVDVRSLRDITRGIVIGRRLEGMLGPGEYPQYYLTPRESRHIRGHERVSYLDGLGERHRPDVVAVHWANFDIKGVASSDLVLAGFIDLEMYRPYKVYIPYGAMVPQGLENALVAGKAYNGSHDLLSLARQIADTMCQGAAAGLAAAQILKSGTPAWEADVGTLQRTLVARGLLTEADLLGQHPDPEVALDAYLSTGDFKHLGRAALSADRIASIIRKRLPAAKGGIRRALGRMLCVFADASANDELLEGLSVDLEADPLPREARPISNMPNHGYEPEPAHTINALSLTREMRLVPLLEGLARRIELPGDATDSSFCYAHSIAYAAERLGDPQCRPALQQLLQNPQIRGRTIALGGDPRKTVDWVGDRYAYLELCAARALARCADAQGYAVLIGYLEDIRLFLARSALAELRTLSAADLGFPPAPWRAWLEASGPSLACQPLTRRFD